VELGPPTLIEEAAASEGWNAQDHNQWAALQGRLEDLGVTRLHRHGPRILIADHPGPFTSTEIRDAGNPPTPAAVLDLIWKLTLPEAPFYAEVRVLVFSAGLPRPDVVGDEETGTVLAFDLGTGVVGVQLTSVPTVVPYATP
jgi:hypothetical protein